MFKCLNIKMAPRGTLLKGTNTKIHARPVTPNELSAASDFSFFSYVLFLQGKSAKRKSAGPFFGQCAR